MRTTLDIEDDVLYAAKEAAKQRKISVGAVISELARQSLLPPLPKRGGIVTKEAIDELRDDGIY